MTPTEQTFTVILDDDDTIAADGRLPGGDAGPTWAKHRVTMTLDEGDTSGHAMAGTTVSIVLNFEDDVEGHALSLNFPSAEKAEAFRRRLLVSGAVAGALVVGVTAAQLVSTSTATGVGAGAAPAPIVRPWVNPRAGSLEAAPIVAAPLVVQPKVNPRIPAEDLAPIAAPIVAAPIVAQPKVNPRVPAEDLAPTEASSTGARQSGPNRSR